MTAPIASGGSEFAGWGLHPLESAALPRRTPIPDLHGNVSRRRLPEAITTRRLFYGYLRGPFGRSVVSTRRCAVQSGGDGAACSISRRALWSAATEPDRRQPPGADRRDRAVGRQGPAARERAVRLPGSRTRPPASPQASSWVI